MRRVRGGKELFTGDDSAKELSCSLTFHAWLLAQNRNYHRVCLFEDKGDQECVVEGVPLGTSSSVGSAVSGAARVCQTRLTEFESEFESNTDG